MLYIFWFLHQTTTRTIVEAQTNELYIFWFLHQTTTMNRSRNFIVSCISFDSYIKPQLCPTSFSFCSVVYLLIPTSNHNSVQLHFHSVQLYIFWFLHQTTTCATVGLFACWLYIFWFLHQTTTFTAYASKNPQLYIFWFLHQTTTCQLLGFHHKELYIFWFLHQTTTWYITCKNFFRCISFDSYIKPQPSQSRSERWIRCISFDSYIKPQLLKVFYLLQHVVYLLIPTSNHNV